MQEFSLLMSVYKNENPLFFEEALESVLASSVQPNQFVLIKDGELTPALEQVIDSFKGRFNQFLEYQFMENQGLGKALHKGVELCSYNLIARFDSDDVCVKDRFKWQLERFLEQEDLVLLGGQIQEFSGDRLDNKRVVPLESDEIKRFSEYRNPFNHMTVMFRRDKVLECGNYRDVRGFEDYDLWLRILQRENRSENLPQVLVHARAGIDLMERRRGLAYLKQIQSAYRLFYRDGLISRRQYIKELIRRGTFSLIPKGLQLGIYRMFLRSK